MDLNLQHDECVTLGHKDCSMELYMLKERTKCPCKKANRRRTLAKEMSRVQNDNIIFAKSRNNLYDQSRIGLTLIKGGHPHELGENCS